jgi:hypothetical protein
MEIRNQFCPDFAKIVTFILVVLLIWLFNNSAAAQVTNKGPMFEPLFGMQYLPTEIKFEPAPNVVYRCKDLMAPRRILFLFGKAAKGNIDFYYVSGLIEVVRDARSAGGDTFEAENDDGIIVVVSPDGCRDIGAGYAWSLDERDRRLAEKIGITDRLVSALLTDAVDREVKAFGGVKSFLSKLEATGVDESKLQPQLREKLSVIRKKTKRGEAAP